MKVDDERTTPDGWVRVYWPEEAIELLKKDRLRKLASFMILEMMNMVLVMMLCFG